jgi:hypothetical protein
MAFYFLEDSLSGFGVFPKIGVKRELLFFFDFDQSAIYVKDTSLKQSAAPASLSTAR